jgi:hypothetical protein
VQQLQMAARKTPVSDGNHLGIEGANYFAAMTTREPAEAMPKMRPLLLP